MNLSGPYRTAPSSPILEDDLWLRLDDALEVALEEPWLAWQLAWWILDDCGVNFPDVRRAVEAMLWELFGPLPPDYDLP